MRYCVRKLVWEKCNIVCIVGVPWCHMSPYWYVKFIQIHIKDFDACMWGISFLYYINVKKNWYVGTYTHLRTASQMERVDKWNYYFLLILLDTTVIIYQLTKGLWWRWNNIQWNKIYIVRGIVNSILRNFYYVVGGRNIKITKEVVEA